MADKTDDLNEEFQRLRTIVRSAERLSPESRGWVVQRILKMDDVEAPIEAAIEETVPSDIDCSPAEEPRSERGGGP